MKIFSEKGLTLIEVLATLTISFIIFGSIYGVFISVNKNYTGLTEKNNLSQEANIIITTIKKYYLANSEFILKYNEDKETVFIGKNDSEPLIALTDQNIKIEEFLACKEEITGMNKKKCEDEDKYENITTWEPLYLKITLSNKKGQKYNIDTMINKY
ncbi:PilW family protein [Cytobacillus dafuensis]|uniref:Type II secretion system protein n=1 Tax=Cytobacillus dafuensis TaxID=1742359 RepID=A0A5B8Z6T1_CYTDA|nr:type II secretion system protein [Cytobacillus dafuensis]QED48805.1 type II secretion system protein [Cytobacillus dafuensis]